MADLGTGVIFVFSGLDGVDLTSVSMSGISRDKIDTTHLLSSTTRSSIPTDLYDAGTIECEFHVDTANPVANQQIATFMANGVAAWSIAVALIATWSGNGYVTDFSMDFPTEELTTGSFTLTCTGAITTSNT